MATKAKKSENQQKLENFIKNNNLTFEEGQRNTDSVVLSGYALFIGETDWTVLVEAIDEVASETCDCDYHEELERVFDYAEANNYGNWWKNKKNTKAYKF